MIDIVDRLKRPRKVAFHGIADPLCIEAAAEIERLRAENVDQNMNVIAFCALYAARYAEDAELPLGYLHPTHYDILEKAGARMTDFKRWPGDE